jgi:hypothetical protein
MNFERTRLMRFRTANEPVDDTRRRTTGRVRPFSNETAGLAMETNVSPVLACTTPEQAAADPVPMAMAPAIVFALKASMTSCTTVLLW